ncbi:MAG: sulfatase [Phycisphaeraceae bacterium]|nr:sulfatase [Phycisphaeraceae bacterium]
MRLIAMLLLALLAPMAGGQPKRPNIVVFLVDDMGWQDTSVPFFSEVTDPNRRYRTPSMERLAREGMRLTSAYACSVCSPTRISLMTGQNAARHRVTNWTLQRDTSTDARHPRLEFPRWNVNGLSPDPRAQGVVERAVRARALPDFLRSAGYRTIHVGKAHFGAIGTPGADPRSLGFDVNIAGHAAGAPASYRGEHNFSQAGRTGQGGPSAWDVPGLEAYHGREISLTEALTIEALREVRSAIAEGGPFFLYLAHYAVHAPIMADPLYVEGYGSLHPTEAAYASMIEAMDASLGAVLDELDRQKVARNTLVIFLSDNGGLSATARGGPRDTHNLPLSAGKGSAREGGVRVPMLVRWPGVVAAGSASDAPVIIEDVFATLVEVGTGLDPGSDGVSLVGLLGGGAGPDHPLVWHMPNYWGVEGPGYGPSSSIRSGRWKLTYMHDPASAERATLFDLEADIGESRDLVRERPEVARALAAELEALLEARGAQWPRVRETGERIEGPVSALEVWLGG